MLQSGWSRDRVPMKVFFHLTSFFQPHYGRGDDSASNRNKYQESSGGGGGRVCKAGIFTAICEPTV
jgi:hypothetical protein